MKAILNNYRQSPRKMRLVADAIKGKSVKEAKAILLSIPKVARVPLLKLLQSALSNARENYRMTETDSLLIEDLRIDSGSVLKRMMPRARGSAYRIKKRASKVTLVLAESETLNA